MDNSNPRVIGLRNWAEGTTCDMAGVELLIGFHHSHLVEGPWVRPTGAGSYWFDPEVAAAENGYLSGGEARVLSVAMSLVSSDHPVDLRDVLTGIDPKTFVLVTQAMGQAFGSNSVTAEAASTYAPAAVEDIASPDFP